MTTLLYCKCPDTCTKCGAELPLEFCNVHANAFEMMKALDELLAWYEDVAGNFDDDSGFKTAVFNAKLAFRKANAQQILPDPLKMERLKALERAEKEVERLKREG